MRRRWSRFSLWINGCRRDPFLLPDMEIAVTRIYRAVLSGEKIAIYGDFDADGITSTAVLVQGLRAFNVEAIPYIPHRINEGHGLKIAALEALHKAGRQSDYYHRLRHYRRYSRKKSPPPGHGCYYHRPPYPDRRIAACPGGR